MSFGESIRRCLRHPFTFAGRARRSEFWWYALSLEVIWLAIGGALIAVVVAAGGLVISGTDATTGQANDDDVITRLTTLAVVTGCALLFSSLIQLFLLGANARRLHDTDHSAHWLWFYLAGLAIVPILMGIAEGTPGPNRFGPDPKEPSMPGGADVANG